MSIKQKLNDERASGIKYLSDYSYDDALIGISDDNRAIYDYDKMVSWLANEENLSEEEAEDWINYNTIRALPYFGANAPIVMYALN